MMDHEDYQFFENLFSSLERETLYANCIVAAAALLAAGPDYALPDPEDVLKQAKRLYDAATTLPQEPGKPADT